MKGKILFAAGLAVGYVLGTRAGRERYETIKAAADKLWNSGPVQKQVDVVEDFVRDHAPEVVEFVADGAKKVATQVATRSKAAKSGTAAAAKKPATRTRSTSSRTRSTSDD